MAVTTGKEAAAAGWCRSNERLIAQADALIAAQLADRKHFGDHTVEQLCGEVLDIMRKGLSVGESALDKSETSSVLLLGEAGSGKTHVVEWCLGRLRQEQQSLVVLRAHGGAYSTDVECIRHLAAQVADQLVTAPHANASFEQGMEWIRSVLRESFQHASAVVIVLDKFEHFCSRARQTLLYNLFDIAQEVGVRLCIVGMSERMDVIGMLEKRIKSRFSMRHLHAFLPTRMEELVKVLMAKLRLAPSGGLTPSFLKQLHQRLEAALLAKRREWRKHLELGRSPTWFLHQCLPVLSVLRAQELAEAEAACALSPPPPAKRRRATALAGSLPSATKEDVQKLLLGGLSETEHIVLLALFRMGDRQVATRTLSLALHEIQLLQEGGGLVAGCSLERYASAFDRLVQMKLVELCSQGAGDVSRRYLPCQSLVDRVYAGMVQELGRASATPCWNPLRTLPEQVQQWAVRQRGRQ